MQSKNPIPQLPIDIPLQCNFVILQDYAYQLLDPKLVNEVSNLLFHQVLQDENETKKYDTCHSILGLTPINIKSRVTFRFKINLKFKLFKAKPFDDDEDKLEHIFANVQIFRCLQAKNYEDLQKLLNRRCNFHKEVTLYQLEQEYKRLKLFKKNSKDDEEIAKMLSNIAQLYPMIAYVKKVI
ncbi:hypothetical protein OXYTRIMIC_306 [Oxytricha trifallax]|uniref:Uncharacterized protein n=1 Tax=Oxytricha trifallax TaxID=1172189 RepID=A0A073ICD2_9SPIT|nr:hypothetical protein OXYTRIMIC_306 [Oxytricha trifallax]